MLHQPHATDPPPNGTTPIDITPPKGTPPELHIETSLFFPTASFSSEQKEAEGAWEVSGNGKFPPTEIFPGYDFYQRVNSNSKEVTTAALVSVAFLL